MAKLSILCMFILLVGVLGQQPYPEVDVDTEYGTVRGRVLNVHNGVQTSDINVFQGVPFAKDTAGVNRFRVGTAYSELIHLRLHVVSVVCLSGLQCTTFQL